VTAYGEVVLILFNFWVLVLQQQKAHGIIVVVKLYPCLCRENDVQWIREILILSSRQASDCSIVLVAIFLVHVTHTLTVLLKEVMHIFNALIGLGHAYIL
jgi:hypothetical protein